MPRFSDRLRSAIEHAGLNQKEFAAKAGIKKRALDGYLGVQKSMPPADSAVKMASVLGLSVEYLVSGREVQNAIDITKYVQFRDVLDDLAVLPEEMVRPIKAMIQAAAKR
jgi:transcriptional regulator with XRE-family HTH domain